MHVLFVCTGNVCRSPMAEGIARDRFGDRATFASAGTRAVTGESPTAHSIRAASEIGVDIADIRASHIQAHPVPDLIYVMTEHHRSRVAEELPGFADRIELLDPFGDPIADPYGLDLEFYRVTRDAIAAAIEQRALEWASSQ